MALFHRRSPIDASTDAIIDSSILAANDADNRAESGQGDSLQVDRALDPIHELLRNDATGTLAAVVISRIDEMTLGVRLSLMRAAVECAGAPLVPLVINLLAASMAALRWDGHGWLADVPPPVTEPLKIAQCAMVNTLMIIDADWRDPEIGAVLPVLAYNEPMIRRAAWVALRCWTCTTRSLPATASAVIKSGLADSDPVVRSHAEHIAAEAARRRRGE